MNRSRWPVTAATLVGSICLMPVFATAQGFTPRVSQQRGATLGGLTGAVAGALIGDNNGEAGAGAAIGGVVGAVAGGILGNAKDKERASVHNRRQAYAVEQQTVVRQGAVSINDVVTMSRSGVSPSVIINQIQSRGVLQTPNVSDIIAMHQQGVAEVVITAMQSSRPALAGPVVQRPTVIATPRPVIVEEHYFVPHYAPRPIYRYRPPHHRRGRGIHFQF